ncbi:hypothetical protein [Aquabacter cavernae]|uniref:hypothetical protein n=1 Tax=Aquabacter cavernae TaxID=2496029 RepID=UPI000F8ECD56|nr:hypothetical protein [Aquabacter cavernae]
MAAGWADRRHAGTLGRGTAFRYWLAAGWVLLAITVLFVVLPARYTAQAVLSFDVAVQPPPATVRGITQVLTSRDLALEVLDRLPPADAARLTTPLAPLQDWLGADPVVPRERAAARLLARLSVEPRQGGRLLDIAITASDPRLASEVVRAYVAAFGAMQAGARNSAPEQAEAALPRLSVSSGPAAPARRDPPSLGFLLAAGGCALALLLVSGRPRPTPMEPQGKRQDLPRAHEAAPRVAWLDAGRGAGLPCRRAAHLLADQIAAAPRDRQLIITTSDMPSEMPATFAITLARHLAEDSRVALVALDGLSGELSALISDPWAPGMAEMLFGVAGFGETIYRDPLSRAHVIPPGRDTRGGPGVVGADRLGLILTALRETYDFVIVAAPVLGAAPEAVKLARLSPYVVCVEPPCADEPSVEPYAALAAQGFDRVLMVRAMDEPEAVARPVGRSMLPTLSAA